MMGVCLGNHSSFRVFCLPTNWPLPQLVLSIHIRYVKHECPVPRPDRSDRHNWDRTSKEIKIYNKKFCQFHFFTLLHRRWKGHFSVYFFLINESMILSVLIHNKSFSLHWIQCRLMIFPWIILGTSDLSSSSLIGLTDWLIVEMIIYYNSIRQREQFKIFSWTKCVFKFWKHDNYFLTNHKNSCKICLVIFKWQSI